MSVARRVQPQQEVTIDSINERVIIRAAIIADKKARAAMVRSITPEEFLVAEHVAMWRAFDRMVRQSLEYEHDVMVRLLTELGGSKVDEAYLAELEQEAELPVANLDFYMKRVRWDATRARLLVQGGVIPELLEAAKSPNATPERLAQLGRAIIQAAERGGAKRFTAAKDDLKREYRAEVMGRLASPNFYSFGFPAMDANLAVGAAPGRTGVLVGLSGGGKTTYLLNWVLKMALADKLTGGHQKPRKVLMGAWEMGRLRTLDIMVSAFTQIELERLKKGSTATGQKLLTDDEVKRVMWATDLICERVVFMDNPFFEVTDEERANRKSFKGKRTNDENLDIVESYLAEYEADCTVCVWDLWHYLVEDDSPGAVTKALQRQKRLHEKYGYYGIIVHQLNLKDVEQRSDKRPKRADIKGVGSMVEVADDIFGVHREGQFKDVPDNTLDVVCLKQRDGKLNWGVQFEWDGEKALVKGGKPMPYIPGQPAGDGFDVTEIGTANTRRKASRVRRDG